jgi:flagellum-specific peptidoglycan hydrolase FlgJ
MKIWRIVKSNYKLAILSILLLYLLKLNYQNSNSDLTILNSKNTTIDSTGYITWDECDTLLENLEVYAGRFDSVVVDEKPTQKASKYLWNGAPRYRSWLTQREWRGSHCRGSVQRKAFKAWKRAEINNFIDFMCMAAIEETAVYTDIPPELIVAQAIIESNFGKSRLACEANNYFGHKYYGDNSELFMIAADDSPTDRFTKYRSAWFSIRSHSQLLMRKYRKRIHKEPTLNRWLYALCGGLTADSSKKFVKRGNSVYATSCMTEPCYSQKLKYIINKYRLTDRIIKHNKR